MNITKRSLRRVAATAAAVAAVAATSTVATAQPAEASTGTYYLPWASGETFKVTQGNFGTYSHHKGGRSQYAWDFAMPEGTAVNAARGGTVVRSDWGTEGEGNVVVVSHGNDVCTQYVHLKDRAVDKGEWVNLGERIGYSGNTGNSTGPHLHYQVSRCSDGWGLPSTFVEGTPQEGQWVTAL